MLLKKWLAILGRKINKTQHTTYDTRLGRNVLELFFELAIAGFTTSHFIILEKLRISVEVKE